MPPRALVVSASMGAGHDHAAAELARRLKAQSYEVEVVDFLVLMPWGLGRALRAAYTFQLRRCAWTYELGYRILGATGSLLWRVNVLLVSALTRRSIRRQVIGMQPSVVISTYPFASLVLGHLRVTGELPVPTMTYLTDFAVHPLWVHHGIDVHCAVSELSAGVARHRGAVVAVGTGPLVEQRFSSPHVSRTEMRQQLGVTAEARVVLVVAGSLGLGTVPAVIEAIKRLGEYHVIAVCGRNTKLHETLVKAGGKVTVLGWTDEMAELMAAADVLVENAGGLTAMEAFAAGLPVVTYHAIAGHGRDNARSMSAALVNRYALNEAELAASLHDATVPGPAREALIAAGRALFAGDPATYAHELAQSAPGDAVWVRRPHLGTVRSVVTAPARLPRRLRRVVIPVVLLVMLYGVLTEGAETVAALGVGVVKPPAAAVNRTYVGIRLTSAELRDPTLRQGIETTGATVIVDAQAAHTSRVELAGLASAGVDIANGGLGTHTLLPWVRSKNDCQKASAMITQAAQVRPVEFVPGRDLNAFDQLYCRMGAHPSRLVRPNHAFGTHSVPREIDSGRIYVLDGRNVRSRAVELALVKLNARVAAAHLRIRPLSDLV